jgi:hypothetical protein
MFTVIELSGIDLPHCLQIFSLGFLGANKSVVSFLFTILAPHTAK